MNNEDEENEHDKIKALRAKRLSRKHISNYGDNRFLPRRLPRKPIERRDKKGKKEIDKGLKEYLDNDAPME